MSPNPSRWLKREREGHPGASGSLAGSESLRLRVFVRVLHLPIIESPPGPSPSALRVRANFKPPELKLAGTPAARLRHSVQVPLRRASTDSPRLGQVTLTVCASRPESRPSESGWPGGSGLRAPSRCSQDPARRRPLARHGHGDPQADTGNGLG